MNAEKQWPADGLEDVGLCPVCGSRQRKLLHDQLRDRVFFCAPGVWKLYRCASCGSGYLDPRPTMETIGLAYSNYFTHQSTYDYEAMSWLHRARRQLANGYRNHRFGSSEMPASKLGSMLLRLSPSRCALLDAQARHIPKASTAGATLLDVGCGNGDFMRFAQSAGWTVEGVDPDASAVKAARGQGLNVHQGDIQSLSGSHRYDGITLSHVIEHVHDPLAVLRACFQLLKPGGWIWLDTPNLDAQGYQSYGEHWRGLEPPRHLVLFTRNTLWNILGTTGFIDMQDLPARPLCKDIFAKSEAQSRGDDPEQLHKLGIADYLAATSADWRACKNPAIREFVTLRAWRPS